MRVLIDGDGCPDRQLIVALCKKYQIEVFIYTDYAHIMNEENVILCDIKKDSVDYRIIKDVQKGDLVITQDYGLASFVLVKEGIVLHVSGKEIRKDNEEEFLLRRYLGTKNRRKDKHTKGTSKRKIEDTNTFLYQLEQILKREDMG